jgi:hypothetical protein
MNIKVNESLQKSFSLIPENAVIFGGAIRDLIDDKSNINDIDLLFSSKKEVDEFIGKLKNLKDVTFVSFKGISEKYLELKNVNVTKVYIETYDGSAIRFDCVVPEDDDKSFFTDYDVNSLFGYVSKDKQSIEVVNTFIKKSFVNVDSVSSHIKSKYTANYLIKENYFRSCKIQQKGYRTGDLKAVETKESDFLSCSSVFEQVKIYKESNKAEQNKKVSPAIEASAFVKSNVSSNDFSKENKMSNNSSNAMDFFTKNLIEGAYAGVAAQVIDRLGDSIILAMKKGGLDEVSVTIIESGIKTPIGKAFLSMLVGSGIHFIPADFLQQNKHLQKVADKCVQNAGSEGVQAVFNLAMTFLLPALMGAINDNPQIKALESLEGKFRVPVPENKERHVDDIDIPDLAKFAANKKASLG